MLDPRTGLTIDVNVNDKLSEFAKATFATTLSRKGETPVESHARAALAWCGGDKELAQRLQNYAEKQWFMWASPVIMNAPLPGERLRHMPISCFLTYVSDTIQGLRDHHVETINLTTVGGGVGSHWSAVRSSDEKSRGTIPQNVISDALMKGFAQARGRRGSICAHLHISHPDTPEFINVRIPTQGDPARKCLGTGYHHAVIIPDEFMRRVDRDDTWDLIDPHTKRVVTTVRARDLWKQLLDARMRQGEPFIVWEDRFWQYFPEAQKKLGLKQHGSNLCVAPDTLLMTRDGEQTISDICGQTVEVWNGRNWSQTQVVKTGENQKLLSVTLSNGNILRVTPYHTWYVYAKGSSDVIKKETQELVSGDTLELWYQPTDGVVPTRRDLASAVTVVSIIDYNEISDTYCVNEPILHRAMFNGVVTGNCNEITLPTDEKRTAVCCLSSLNVERINEWWDTPIIEDCLTFLDNVLSYFIENAPAGFEKAVYAAMRERAVGLGAMGFHALLQKLNVPFESKKAKEINRKIFSKIRRRADIHDLYLGEIRGEAPDMVGTGRRFSHKLAIAPNATSANAIGTSPGIEPWSANIFTANTTAGSFTIYNRQLMELLKEKGKYTPAVLESIVVKQGSVQHLDFLTEHEKNVYKTAREIDQRWIVELAADRVPFICQSQSVNLFVFPHTPADYVHAIHMKAWRDGMKGLYYLRSEKVKKANIAGRATRATLQARATVEKIEDVQQGAVQEESSCVSCEG